MNNFSPKISIVMPVYNGAKYIKQSIKSIFNQTYTNFEFIIIDDASTDNSVKIIKSFKDKRIKLTEISNHLQISNALNAGILQAQGKYLCRMDADDISSPNRLEKQIEYLEKHPTIGVVGTWAKDINKFGEIVNYRQTPVGSKIIKKSICCKNPLIHSSIMMKTNLFRKYGYYDSKLNGSEDWDLWLRLSKDIQMTNLPEYLLQYRIHQNSETVKNIKLTQLANIKTILKAIFKYKYSFFNIIYIVKMFISYIIPESTKLNIKKILIKIIKPFVVILKQTANLSALSLRLVKLTGKHKETIHPKHLINITRPWYFKDMQNSDIILDIGCHNGQRTLKTAKLCKKIIGIDKDKKGLILAEKEKIRLKRDNVFFSYCDINYRLPFKNSSFNKILLLDVLEHIHKREFLIKEISRILKKSGKLFISIPNSQTSWKKIQRFVKINSFSDPDHKIEYSKDEIKDFLNTNDFTIENIYPVTLDTPLVGFIDFIGGISLNIYKKIAFWRRTQAQINSNNSIGWEITCKKI